jgi:hypothetical protein
MTPDEKMLTLIKSEADRERNYFWFCFGIMALCFGIGILIGKAMQ